MASGPQTFTRLPTVDASPSAQRVISDIFDKLSQIEALIVNLQARVAILEKKP